MPKSNCFSCLVNKCVSFFSLSILSVGVKAATREVFVCVHPHNMHHQHNLRIIMILLVLNSAFPFLCLFDGGDQSPSNTVKLKVDALNCVLSVAALAQVSV